MMTPWNGAVEEGVFGEDYYNALKAGVLNCGVGELVTAFVNPLTFAVSG
jgi:hypothetical protein